MKKTIIILIVVLSFLGCKEDPPEIDFHVHVGCECGTIIDREILLDNMERPTYWLHIENNCSKNIKKFYTQKEMWDFYIDSKLICLKDSW